MIAVPDHHSGNLRPPWSRGGAPADGRSYPDLLGSEGSRAGLLRFLKEDVDRPYKMLYDLSAIDERMRQHRDGQPASDFTVVYHLLSFERNEYIRIKVALAEDRLSLATVTRHLARCQLVRARSVGHVRNCF